MTDIVHYAEQNSTIYTTTSASAVEVSALTVAWEDLTGAGFAASDDVLILWSWSTGGTDPINTNTEIREGSTFGGASTLATFANEVQASLGLEGGYQFTHLERITLTSGNDFYLGLSTQTSSNTARVGNWSFLAIKLDDLTENTDFFFNENTTAEAPGTTYKSYASVTLPSGGGDDWLILGSARIDVTSSLSTQFRVRFSLGGTGRMEQSHEGEDSDEFYGLGLIAYLASAGASDVCAIQCENATSNTHEHVRSAIFALRMEAFTDHAGVLDQTAVAAPTSGATFKEMDTMTHTASATGAVFYFGQSIADVASDMQPYVRVQDDGADMMVNSDMFVNAISANDPTDQLGPLAFGVADVASGSNTIDLDAAIRYTSTAFNFDEHAIVTFSADLAAGGGPATIIPQIMHHRRMMQ